MTQTNDIYTQHDKAFNNVSAYVVLKQHSTTGVTKVATVAFKFPKDGAGRLSCYLHVLGTRMVKGIANGYGYDKRSASVENAVRILTNLGESTNPTAYNAEVEKLQELLKDCKGQSWDDVLRSNGYIVYQAI